MTRPKTTPSILKPAFDEESVLRFADQHQDQVVGAARGSAGGKPGAITTGRKGAKDPGADRISITLMLKPEVIAHLQEEAGRKGKRVDQIVEKLVTKHLGKH